MTASPNTASRDTAQAADPLNLSLATLPLEAQENFRREAQKIQDVIFTRTMDSGFELIKHFVTINAASVAGATAISSAFAESAKLATPYFFAGMVVAIFVMILVYVNGIQISRGLIKRYHLVIYSGAPVNTFKFTRLMWTGIAITWVFSFSSIALFIAGATILVLKT